MKRYNLILISCMCVIVSGILYFSSESIIKRLQTSNPINDSPYSLTLPSFFFSIADAASCSWSTGYYLKSGKVYSNPFGTGECTWYVDGKERNSNGWTLYFSRGSSRDAYLWYRDQIVIDKNGKKMGYGYIGYPGEIMVFDKWNDKEGAHGHVAYIISNGYWWDPKAKVNKRAWTVRQANWGYPSFGQTWVETVCNQKITQCTFVEDSKNKLKIQNGNSLGNTAYPLLGFIYKK